MKNLVFCFLFILGLPLMAAEIVSEQVLKTSDTIWGFDFLPDGKIIFTEKEGALKLFDPSSKNIIEIKGVPKVVDRGQGGLLDVLADSDFSKNSRIFLSYSAPVEGGQTTRLASARLEGKALKNLKVLFTALPGTGKTQHFGSRILQEKSGDLFLTVGDRGERDLVQDPEQLRGKVFKVKQDGKWEIWTTGHRNQQGADFHPQTGQLWTVEHGPRGGDELNLIEKSKNYGWPVITYGKEYWGPSIGEGTHKKGMEQPKYYYVPSIATSGLMIYSGKLFKNWKGHFFVGALKDTHISQLSFKNGKLREVQKLFEDKSERIRQIKEAPDGAIYYSTDNGKLIKVTPGA